MFRTIGRGGVYEGRKAGRLNERELEKLRAPLKPRPPKLAAFAPPITIAGIATIDAKIAANFVIFISIPICRICRHGCHGLVVDGHRPVCSTSKAVAIAL